jgi:hypothetical protein
MGVEHALNLALQTIAHGVGFYKKCMADKQRDSSIFIGLDPIR